LPTCFSIGIVAMLVKLFDRIAQNRMKGVPAFRTFADGSDHLEEMPIQIDQPGPFRHFHMVRK